ncbi:hypothetical protein AALO_G00096550 [Alosa alosa]|uniref:Uncharacterized protein n=1 Tax=Alosa alosa TaxID=278164 RepID=A0AAV6GTE1_9TELE|nr:hypothetical protein AALO_G00096550 [Alosa alosa]
MDFTPVEIIEENDSDSGEYDQDVSSTTKPVSLAQMKRVSVVLVDCCRPQGQQGTDLQMQTNGDAEQPETIVERIANRKSFKRGYIRGSI